MRLIHQSGGNSPAPHPAAPGQKASVTSDQAAAGLPVKQAGGKLGPKQIAWLRENIDVFRDGEKRAREVIADTERMKREARP